VLLPCFILSQSENYRISITSFTEKEGLSNNDVFCINKDTRGVLWVGTRYGLNRSDGKGFRTFMAADGLKNNLAQL
jgi:ligand-binding sensor domain-containing protein